MVEKRVLRRQTKQPTTVCFDQLCSKINPEREVQTKKFNKEDCQEFSAEKCRSFEHNGVEIHNYRKGWKAFKRKKIPQLLSEKQRKTRLRFAKKYANLTAEDWHNFLFTDECPKYLFQYPTPTNDIVWGLQESDVPPAHTSKATQTWCQKNLPNFIGKDGSPANSTDLNPIENIWSIIDETTYKDPAPKTMKKLKRRLRFAWKNETLDTLKELAHSMPRRLENVIQNKGGHSGY